MEYLPQINQPAPAFNIPDANNSPVQLTDFSGKWVVLYFYPKDNTSGCTLEAQEFSAAMPEFATLNAVVIGVSPDSCRKHTNFINKYDLKVQLLSDESHAMLEKYGVWQEKSMFGNTYMGLVRSTVLIDPKGIIRQAWEKVKPEGHATEVLETIKTLTKS